MSLNILLETDADYEDVVSLGLTNHERLVTRIRKRDDVRVLKKMADHYADMRFRPEELDELLGEIEIVAALYPPRDPVRVFLADFAALARKGRDRKVNLLVETGIMGTVQKPRKA